MAESFQSSVAAYERFVQWMREARDVGQAFRDAGIPIPPELSRIIDAGDPRHEGRRPRAEVPHPKAPSRPRGAQHDWTWIPASDAAPQTLALAVLQAAGAPMTPKDVAEEVGRLLPSCNIRSVYNAGTRLVSTHEISRTDGGQWGLSNPSDAPILHEGHVWAPLSKLTSSEVAAHRRMCILHVLRTATDGMQAMQITRALQDVSWCHAPVNKDLVQDDVEILAESKKIRRMGASRKWEIVQIAAT